MILTLLDFYSHTRRQKRNKTPLPVGTGHVSLSSNMDELVLEKMKLYVAITQKNTAAQERQIQVLTDELESCRSFIESLQLDERDRVKGVSQFSLEKLKSGGR
jgi:hypothetical protein